MKYVLYLLFILSVSLVNCKIDNYEMPGLTLKGKIIDAQNNNLVESSGINGGTVVRLFQNNSPQPLLYSTFPDGTFTNSRVFAGNYSISAIGPFTLTAADPQPLVMNSNKDVEITVIPHVRLNASVVNVTGNKASIKLEFNKLNLSQTLAELVMIWSTYKNPNTTTFPGGGKLTENVQPLDLINGERIFTIENLQQGSTYYFRGSARTNNPGNYYNYTTQLEVKIQ